jgi:hypothetical protein
LKDQTRHRIGTKPKQAIIVLVMFGNTKDFQRFCGPTGDYYSNLKKHPACEQKRQQSGIVRAGMVTVPPYRIHSFSHAPALFEAERIAAYEGCFFVGFTYGDSRVNRS